MSIYHC